MRRSLLSLPLFAGERVGVSDYLGERDSRTVPLTRIAPQSDLSPQAGRGEPDSCTTHLNIIMA
jgi:hypothetical protein